MPDDDADVIWELAADDAFADLVASRRVHRHRRATATRCTSTPPASSPAPTTTTASATPTGPARPGAPARCPTARPTASASRVVNCQMFETGSYGAYRHLVDEDVDLVLHLGDYIYEYPGGHGERGLQAEPHRSTTLADYRLRYASYKADPHLQAAHARFPFVLTWDDHEVANNYMGDVLPGDADPAVGQARKAAAYQAWWENQPPGSTRPTGSDLAVYQALTVGDLAPPARARRAPGRRRAAVPRHRAARHRLRRLRRPRGRGPHPARRRPGGAGSAGSLGRGRRHLEPARQPGGAGRRRRRRPTRRRTTSTPGTGSRRPASASSSSWPRCRNPVVLTGDYHAGMVLDVQAEPFDDGVEGGGAGVHVAADLVGAVRRRRRRPARRSCASSSTSTATSRWRSTPDGSPWRSGCSPTWPTPTPRSRTAATWRGRRRRPGGQGGLTRCRGRVSPGGDPLAPVGRAGR